MTDHVKCVRMMGDDIEVSDNSNVIVKHSHIIEHRGSEDNNGETYDSANTIALNTNSSPKLNLMAELFESEDDDNSEVESFTLDEEPVLETSKFLLSAETTGIHLSDNEIDSESRAKLEALLEAAAVDKHLIDPDLLRRLTSSVSCALDEAAAALAKMRINDTPLPSLVPLSSANVIHKQSEHSQDNSSLNVDNSIVLNETFNEMTEDGESFLSLACSSGRYELAEQLLKIARVNVEDRGLKDTTPLMEASLGGYTDIVKLLLDHGAEVNAQTSQGNTPLMYACASGHEEVVRLLLKAGANVEDHNENGHTALMEAASAGHVEVAKILVEHGSSINTHSNEFKESALTLACYKGHLEMVRFLLEAGADQEHKTDEMHTALMEASMDGHVEVARLLLDSGAQVNMPADSFESPLTLAACGGHVELAMLLLERSANIEEVNDEGYTPLMEAAREGHEEMVALLLSQGADINAQTEETQETALTLACCGGFLDVADFLIKAGADIEAGANTPLMEAAQEGHLDLVRHLISAAANVNAKTSSGDTALMYACENGHTDVADLLLKAGANLEHEAEGGRTPLMKAARAGHLCTIQFLINHGANVNKVTANNDHTPLSLACAGGHLAVVELLLANGADPTHRLKDNSTMLIEAAKGGHTTVVQLLIDYPSNLLASPSPVDVSQLTTSEVSTMASPRAPSHDPQLDDASAKPHSTTTTTHANHGKPIIPKVTSKKTSKESNNSIANTSNKVTEPIEGYVQITKGRGGNKILERSLSDSGSPQFSSAFLSSPEELSDYIIPNLTPASVDELERRAQIFQAGYNMGLNAPIHSDTNTIASSVPSACFDIAKLQKQFKIGESPFQVPTSIPTYMQHVTTAVSDPLTTNSNISAAIANASSSLTSSICSTTTNTASTVPTPPVNRRLRSNSKSKSSKQHLQHHATVVSKTSISSPSNTPEDVEKMNLKNAVNLEAALEQTNAAMNQTHSILQQQILLSEIAQNPAALQLLQAAASNATLPFLLPRLFDSNVTQQQNLQIPQTSTPVQMTNVITTTTISSSVQDTLKKTNVPVLKTIKANKAPKGVSVLNPLQPNLVISQQQQGNSALQLNQLPNNDQLLKNHITASTQTDTPSAIQQISESSCPNVSSTTPFVDASVSPSATTTANNMGLFGIGAPAFPVTLTLTPVTSSVPTTTAANKASIISTIIPYPVNIEESPNSFVVSHSSGGDSDSGPNITQLSSNTVTSHIVSSTCADSSNFIVPNTLPNMWTPPSGFVPVSHVFAASLAQAQANFSALSNLTFSNLSPNTSITDQLTSGQMITNIQQTQVTVDTSESDVTTTTPIAPSTNNTINIPSPPPWYPPIDLDSQTDSNHDTALTLACSGGHDELVTLLLQRGAEIEHRDKKGFTPLMLSATAGHANVLEVLLSHGSDMEAQSERTKDTALSLACSSGRYEVVEILLSRGANKEHRNVSDYTPLSLAASGGYVNIIKLLLNHGAEINSRTGSKLGISPLMLAAMNGHASTVKLLLDMGSDINAQIETNRNTALTLACFQGRCEVVGQLLDRKANVEHRAKTGLTPLMEAASGGYVEVGRVLLDKGADVNAAPVPSSRDTALTIAADKGHYRFVELLLSRGSAFDVKNKKGNSPLWLACNGGHLDVVQLLVNSGCDIDSQDNRKVSCLMAAFRKGHVKVVKWMVKHVNQFPSDQEIQRYMALINDKELVKKCNQCTEIIRQAKERQAAEANKNATILLEEIDMERSREENRKAAAARRRERKRIKKKEKQDLIKAAKVVPEDDKKERGKLSKNKETVELKLPDDDDENDDDDDYEDDGDNDADNDSMDEDEENEIPPQIKDSQSNKDLKPKQIQEKIPPQQTLIKKKDDKSKKLTNQLQHLANQPTIVKKKDTQTPFTTIQQTAKGKKKEESHAESSNSNSTPTILWSLPQRVPLETPKTYECNSLSGSSSSSMSCNARESSKVNHNAKVAVTSAPINRDNSAKNNNGMCGDLSVETIKDVNGNSGASHMRSPNYSAPKAHPLSGPDRTSVGTAQSVQPLKKGQKREDGSGWKEVIRKSKKVVVPANAISRVIGRGGCNINAIREISGAHIEVEKQKGQGDRMVIIKGSADATRNAQQLIAALSKEAEKDLSEIVKSLGLTRTTNANCDEPSIGTFRPPKSSSTVVMSSTVRQTSSNSGVFKSASMNAVPVSTTGVPNSATVAVPTRLNGITVRSSAPPSNVAPFPNASTGGWNAKPSGTRIPSNISTAFNIQSITGTTNTKATVSYTMAVSAKAKNTKTTTVSNTVPAIPKVVSSSEVKQPSVTIASHVRPTSAPLGAQPFNQMGTRPSAPNIQQTAAKTMPYLSNLKQPFNNTTTVTSTHTTTTVNTNESVGNVRSSSASAGITGVTPEYTPFNNLFSKVAQQTVWGQSKDAHHKPNFASVAASGLTSGHGSSSVQPLPSSLSSTLILPIPQSAEQELSIDASKAPGYRGNMHVSPSNASLASTPSSSSGTSNLGPIGSGPRSAPCTPPLTAHTGPLTPSNNSGKLSSPPMSTTPTSPPPQQPQQLAVSQQRALPDSQNNMFNLAELHMNGSLNANAAIVTTFHSVNQQPSGAINTNAHVTSSASNAMKVPSYNLPPASNIQRLFPSTSTYSQHNTLTTGSSQPLSDHNSMFSGNVQSNLNPNAPDFSTRTAPHPSLNGSQIGNQSRMGSNVSNASQSQVQPATILLQDQMRAAILAASCNLQLQTLQNQHAARMQHQYASVNQQIHHPQMTAPDFGNAPPTPEALRLLHTAINSLPFANMINPPPHNPPPLNMMQPQSNYLQQRQSSNQRPFQQSINALSSNKNMETVSDNEERKFPPPIGTERAQRKNPSFSPSGIGGSMLNSGTDSNQTGIWPFNCTDMAAVDPGEWMNQQQHLHSSLTGDAMSNFMQRYGEEAQHFDQSYQMNMSNAVNYVTNPQVPIMNMNGVPPHLLSSALYSTSSAPSAMSSSQPDADYWTGKIPPLSSTGLGNALPGGQQSNPEQKMNWNNWNHHT